MKNLEESIYNKLIEKEKKPNPKDHTTLSFKDMEIAVRKATSIKKVADDKKLLKNKGPIAVYCFFLFSNLKFYKNIAIM